MSTSFQNGQAFRFRLLANPTKKIDTKGGPDGLRRKGKRVPVPVEHLYKSLGRRAESFGFSVDQESTTVQAGYVYFKKSRSAGEQSALLRSVRYDGLLKVTDIALFKKGLASGIGPGKSHGFGLLSIASVGGD